LSNLFVCVTMLSRAAFGFNIIGPIKAGPPQDETDLAGVFISKIIDGGAAQLVRAVCQAVCVRVRRHKSMPSKQARVHACMLRTGAATRRSR